MGDRRPDSNELLRSEVAEEPESDASELERDEQQEAAVATPHEPVLNSSPWSIGMSHYDQRDLYTTNASTDDDGYACGPSYHPEEGSYAYPREFHPGPLMHRVGTANLYEREAWPWLNYTATDPYFAHINHLHDHDGDDGDDDAGEDRRSRAREALRSITTRATALSSRVLRVFRRSPKPVGPTPEPRTDAQLRWDVERALLRQDDLDDHDIAVDVLHAEVTLEGTVPDRRSKRAAGKTAAHVPGIRAVHNHLEIREDDTTDADLALASPFAFGA